VNIDVVGLRVGRNGQMEGSFPFDQSNRKKWSTLKSGLAVLKVFWLD